MLFHTLNIIFFLFFLSCVAFVLCLLFSSTSMSLVVNISIFKLSGLSVSFPFLFDSIGILFCALVCFISANVIMFSVVYMSNELFITRFTWLVGLFVGSINFMVIIPNSLFFLIGWDGLGVISFVLVIYYQNNVSLCGGIMTCLSNRVGDVFLIVSLIVLGSCGSWSFFSLDVSEYFVTFLFFILVLGAFTNSAQVPFSAWLPMAIAAPTPISALVHSSTLVTAGVYLLVRFSGSLSSVPSLLVLIIICSSITIVIASVCAISHWDANNIVALSTLSQLGFMVFCVSVKMPSLAFFHLSVHAIFNSLIFICVGVLIHCYQTQDLRNIGGAAARLPFVSFVIVSAELSIAGFPFLSGFFSNDLIIEGAAQNSVNSVCYLLVIFSVFCTVFYSVRLTGIVLHYNMRSEPLLNTFDSSFWYIIPIVNMCVLSVVGSYSIRSLFIDAASFFTVTGLINILPILCLVEGVCLSFAVMKFGSFVGDIFSSLLFLNMLTTQSILSKPLEISYNTSEVDQGWFEYFGATGVSNVLISLSWNLSRIQVLVKVPAIFSILYWIIFFFVSVVILWIHL